MNSEQQLASKLKNLRLNKGLSIAELAQRTTISRATISRIENAEVSPTAHVLASLCASLGLSISALMSMVENNSAALIKQSQQLQWKDEHSGFTRRCVSPPHLEYRAEVINCTLPAGTEITYEFHSSIVQEHHLVMLSGQLELQIANSTHHLNAGDCLRYRLQSGSRFKTDEAQGAEYLLVLVQG